MDNGTLWERWEKKFPDFSKWQHQTPEVAACADYAGRGIELKITYPAPADLRIGNLVVITPDQARALARQLQELVETAAI